MEPVPTLAPPPHPHFTPPTPSSTSPDLNHSCPPSPSTLLDESREVTARLYSSLQLSRNLQVKGQPLSDHSHRQVSFQFTSPLLKGTGGSDESRTSLKLHNPYLRGGPGQEGEKAEAVVNMGVDLQNSVENSNRQTNGSKHIQDMENIRAHLQTMFRSTATLETGGNSRIPESADNHSFNSDSTSQLLGEMVGGIEELFSSSHQHVHDVYSPETTVIRESLNRERIRRKQYEGQVLVLQRKAVELQHKLSFAVSADRKKDIMIEQLDKTLAKVVEGWTKHDHVQSDGMRRLQEEKQIAEGKHILLQESLHQVETSLSLASEALEQEQKNTQHQQKTIRQLELRLEELDGSLSDVRCEVERVSMERSELCVERDRLHLQTQEAQSAFTRFQEQTANGKRLLEDKTVQLTNELQEQRECNQREKQHLVEVRQQLKEMTDTLLRLKEEREEAQREMDTERTDRVLERTRLEAQCSQLEVELKQATEGLLALQQEQVAMKEHHRKQLLDLNARHETELSSQLQQHQQSIHTLTQNFHTRLADLQQQSVFLEESKTKLEGQREELVSRLQSLLHSHWTEAIRLLSTQTEGPSLPLLWDEVGMNRYLALEPSSSTNISAQCRAAVHTHNIQRNHDGEDIQASIQQPYKGRCGLSGKGQVRVMTEETGIVEDTGPEMEERGDCGVLLNHSLSFNPLEPQQDSINVKGQEDLCYSGDDLMGWMEEQKEDVPYRDGSGGRQQWAGRGTSLTSDPIPSHDPYLQPGSGGRQQWAGRGTSLTSDPIPSHDPYLQPGSGGRQQWAGRGTSLTSDPIPSHDPYLQPGSGGRQQWAGRGTSLTSDPIPSHDPYLHPGRRSELHYYVSMLLDRSPGKPVESPTRENTGLQLSSDNVKSQQQSPVDTTLSAENQVGPITRTPPNTGPVSDQPRPLIEHLTSRPEGTALSLQLISTLAQRSFGESEEKLSHIKKQDLLPRNSVVSRVTAQGSGVKALESPIVFLLYVNIPPPVKEERSSQWNEVISTSALTRG
ncbi:hypothetical protein DPEC_G00191950 [Dallia pectoralis]|uniref:Uncharacterized protein n=1 Tax=Dallia pectoralis TaxID=75939 RepID=A0ACC2GCI7_DALPE|nr:hypothetical protein DPEC_G00191950 [Dallia pectoralis]